MRRGFVCRSGANSGAAPDRGTRSSGSRIRAAGILEHPRHAGSRRAAAFEAKLFKHNGEDVEVSIRKPPTKSLPPSVTPSGKLPTSRREKSAAIRLLRSRLQTAAGRLQPLCVTPRETHHVAGSETLRRSQAWRRRISCADHPMRTDSVKPADARAQVREMIPGTLWIELSARKPNYYKN